MWRARRKTAIWMAEVRFVGGKLKVLSELLVRTRLNVRVPFELAGS